MQNKEQENIESSLYDRTVKCPICNYEFKTKDVKSSTIRIASKDSDTFIRYSSPANPYFYNVWICPSCGYANMRSDFNNINKHQKELIKEYITPQWTGKKYPEIYNVNIAIERFKLSLYNSIVSKGKYSTIAMNCLKIAWMYRLIDNKNSENIYMKQAIKDFCNAYINEDFPIYGMNQATMMYLIGELYRRIGDNENSLKWFSKLITTQGADQKIKDIARDQRDLIKETFEKEDEDKEIEEDKKSVTKKTKKGFFSKLFK